MAAAIRLTTGEVDRLRPYVDAPALTAFRARTGAPWRFLPVVLRAGAVTLGTNVAFRSGRYDPSTARGLALIAHECVHVRQYREMGYLRFLVSYLRGALAVRFVHERHPLEQEPRAVQALVWQELGGAG